MQTPARFRDHPEQSIYVVVGILAVVALYIVAFIVKNSERAEVDFIFFSAATSLIWVILISLVLGGIAGIGITRLARRARERAAEQAAAPPPRTLDDAPVRSLDEIDR